MWKTTETRYSTFISCRRWTRAKSCITHIVVYTLVDAQRDNAQTLLLPLVVNLFYNYSKLYNKSNVNRRKYCQLSLTDEPITTCRGENF